MAENLCVVPRRDLRRALAGRSSRAAAWPQRKDKFERRCPLGRAVLTDWCGGVLRGLTCFRQQGMVPISRNKFCHGRTCSLMGPATMPTILARSPKRMTSLRGSRHRYFEPSYLAPRDMI